MNNTPPLWTKAFVFLLLGNLFTFMSFQMLLPNLPPYIASIGGSSLQVGLVTTSFSVAAILIRPFIGHILLTKKGKCRFLSALSFYSSVQSFILSLKLSHFC